MVFLVSACLLHTMMGCGNQSNSTSETDNSLTPTDQKLGGQWIAERPNSRGDQIVLNMAPGNGERTVQVMAIRPQGDTVNITDGAYAVSGNRLAFTFTRIPNYSAPFTVTANDLTLGTDIYHKATNSQGAEVAGQIQIPSSAPDGSVTIESLPVPGGRHFVPGEILVLGSGPANRGSSPAGPSGMSALSAVAPSFQNAGRSYQKMIISPDEEEISALSVASQGTSLQELALAHLAREDRLEQATLNKIEELKRQGIEAIPNMILRTQSLSSPNDSLFSSQWNLEVMNITDTWGLVNPRRDVVVAVIDTGIVDHPDLRDHVLLDKGYDFVMESISRDGGGPDRDPTDPGDRILRNGDSSWHGTHLAGIIAADIDNGVGIAGISSLNNRVKVLPLRAMGDHGDGTIFDVGQAIYYAAKLPNIAECRFTSGVVDGQVRYTVDATTCTYGDRPVVNIINLSLGAPMTAEQAGPLNAAIDAAAARGVLIVTAAGNHAKGPGWCLEGTGSNKHWERNDRCNFYPAANPNTLSIGAVHPNLSIASYSDYGSDSNNTQFLVAPGGVQGGLGVTSTTNPAVQGGYGSLNGTSQAAAHVSGVAALLMTDQPSLTAARVKEALQVSAIDLGAAGRDIYYGYGFLNPCGALLAARGSSPSGAGGLRVSSDSINFGTLGSSDIVLVSSSCGSAPLSGISATKTTADGGNWLDVSIIGTTTTPTRLSFSINRSGLRQGDYTGTVTVNSPSGNKTIQVRMTVGVAGTSRDNLEDLRQSIDDLLSDRPGYNNEIDLGEIQVILVNAEDRDRGVAEPRGFRTVTDFNANYQFHFNGIPPGRYYLDAGVDANHNSLICDGLGRQPEPCFHYPTPLELSAATRQNNIVLTY